MKTPSPRDEPEATHRPAADQPLASAGPAESTLDDSPRQVAQRHQIDTAFAAGEAPNRTGMPDTLKAGIESLSGQDMSDVRVHRNSDKPGQLNALAYAQGNDIHLAPGQEQHLPHEAWHVVQQREGRVQATTQMAGMGVNDDVGLEAEADAMGAQAAGPVAQRALRPGLAIAPPPMRHGAVPLQRKWVPSGDGIQRWEPVKDGFVWYFDEKHRLMSFAYEGERSQLSGEVLKEMGVWRAYGDWQLMGWGIEGFGETQTVMVKEVDYAAKFGEYVTTGKRRWAEFEKAMEGGAGRLDPETQAARDWFFGEHYKTDVKPDSGESQIDSNYRFLPDRIKTMAGKGSYSNRYAPGKGVITADSNYALKTGEDYYNPKTGAAESFSNSEVLFQQWQLAKRGVDKPSPLRTVERRHVSGTGLPMVTVIQNWTLGKVPKKQDLAFKQGTDGFFAMLAVPNVVSSIWLVRDHGLELGVSTIAQIDLLKTKSIDIHFA